jgi:hypothetical protein
VPTEVAEETAAFYLKVDKIDFTLKIDVASSSECLEVKVLSAHARKVSEGVEAELQSFLNQALGEGKRPTSRPGWFTTEESEHGIH